MSRSLFALLNCRFGPRQDAWTRRDMLRASMAATVGLLLSDRFGLAQEAKPGGGKRVLVVGAGFGGLSAAHELASLGYNVYVVEARNRVGGRVLTFGDFIKGKTVEGGGELTGPVHLTWVAYAKKFGLEFIDVTE